MPGNTCPGRLANIRTQVERLRLINLAEHLHAAVGQFHHLGTGLHIQVFNGRLVRIGNHQQVPARIRIPVEDYKCFLPSKNDQIFFIGGLRLYYTKNAVSLCIL